MQEVESTDQRRAPPAARPCLAGDAYWWLACAAAVHWQQRNESIFFFAEKTNRILHEFVDFFMHVLMFFYKKLGRPPAYLRG